jgi:Gpi18-like mannosyltransferase
MPKKLSLSTSFLLFVILNLSLYLFVIFFHSLLPFQNSRYLSDSYHYFEDPVASGGQFLFLRSWGQYDAQWFLTIAQNGYPLHPTAPSFATQSPHSGLIYAFFPLYPITLAIFDQAFHHLELTAFILNNLLLVLNFYSLIRLISLKYPLSVSLKTIALLFTFPFSIFFRSYFSESLYLFLLIWFVYFLMQKKFIAASLLLGLTNITRGSGILCNLFFLYLLFRSYLHKSVSTKQVVVSFFFICLPLELWVFYNYIQTGDPLYFHHVLSTWFISPNFLSPLLHNLYSITILPFLPFHFFHTSQIDTSILIVGSILLYLSRKHLPQELWGTALCLWLTPLLTHDLMSFSRYSSVVFPLFIYLAKILKPPLFCVTVFLFTIGLFVTSLFFVNWYWVG